MSAQHQPKRRRAMTLHDRLTLGYLGLRRWLGTLNGRRLGLGLLVVASSLLCVAVALGRPGGGGSFSSGGSSSRGSSGGSSGGGIGEAIAGLLLEILFRVIAEFILWLVVTYPAIGIPVLLGIAVAIFALVSKRRWAAVVSILGLIGITVLFQKNLVAGYVSTAVMISAGLLYGWLTPDKKSWSTRTDTTTAQATDYLAPAIEPARRPPLGGNEGPRAALERIAELDSSFSPVLFEDFAYLLFAEVHRARGGNELGKVAPYVQQGARNKLASRPVSAVRDVIVGALRVVSVHGIGAKAQGQPIHPATFVLLEFEANYTEVDTKGREQAYYTIERWQLTRSNEAKSRPPSDTYVLPCPACGAPLEVAVGGACTYCKKVIADASFSWVVTEIALVRREERGPVLTSDGEEQGTNLPTIVGPGAAGRLGQLKERDPSFDLDRLRGRVDLIFAALQVGWSNRDLTGVRPFVSDNLYQSLGYWIVAYRQAKLRNVTEQAEVSKIELAQCSADSFFDALTLRVRAVSLDFVLNEQGDLVSGSRDKLRIYTEYWTLIRTVKRQGPASEAPVCPSCGAPLAINMAGHCEHCQAKVTSGEFDWVLSRIEQDEVYTG